MKITQIDWLALSEGRTYNHGFPTARTADGDAQERCGQKRYCHSANNDGTPPEQRSSDWPRTREIGSRESKALAAASDSVIPASYRPYQHHL